MRLPVTMLAMDDYGCASMFGRLRRALVREPDACFGESDPADWGYTARPDQQEALQEHRALVSTLQSAGVEVTQQRGDASGLADAIFVFDPVLMTPGGAVLLRMGKVRRGPEVQLMLQHLKEDKVPILGYIQPPGTIEGGDLLWLDSRTLAAGVGFRTNREGIRQLAQIVEPQGISLLPVELPYFKGPGSCLHLLSLISLLDRDLAAVFLPLLSVPFFRELESRGIDLVPVPEAEFPTQGPNVLAMGPRRVLILRENSQTIRRLEAKGCQVSTYKGDEISHKAEGGPTCLVLPLLRGDHL